MAYIGCKGIYITVLRKTAFGNEHAMIRWIKKGEDSYDIDFSIAEKYLDTAMKRMGKIPAVVIYAWVSETGWEYFGGGNINKEAPLPVTYEDKIGGTPTAGDGPMWGDPKINAFLKPVFDGMRERLKTRGIEKSMLVGICTDARPFDKAIADLKAVSSGCPWMVATHPYTTEVGKTVKEAVGFMAHVWGINTTPMPSEGRTYGWKNPVLETAFPRYGCSIVGHSLQTWSAISAFRVVMEAAMTSPAKGQGLRGLGRLGADFWHILPSNQSYHSRYPHYGDDACNPGYSADYNIGRGKTCPVSCARLEMIKEGIQEMETRIYLEKALTDKALMAKLGDVAQKAQAILDDRTIAIVKARGGASTSKAADPGWLWFMGSGWQKRSENLYDAAADAAKKLK